MTTLRTTNIRDHNLRAAAELIDRTVGKTGNREVTADDLDAVTKLIAKQGGGVLQPKQLEIIERALPQLRALLGTEDKKPSLTPFAAALWTTAIADPKVRDCAKAIAELVGGSKGGEDLQLGAFLDARDAMTGRLPPGREDHVSDAKQKLAEAVKAGLVTLDAVNALDAFFLDGVGGIMSHGPVKISGKAYDDVFQLPVKTVGKDGKHDIEGAIEEYERRFRDVSYDRIYIQGPNDELYVALQPKGKLKDVDAGYRVSMRDEMDKAASGTVVRTVDVANSFGEATWMLWADTLKSAAESLTGGLKKLADNKLNGAINDAANAVLDGSASKEKKFDFKAVGLVAWGVVTSAGAFVNWPLAVGALVISGGAITAGSLMSWMQKSSDLAPIFHAMGVTVNKPGAVAP